MRAFMGVGTIRSRESKSRPRGGHYKAMHGLHIEDRDSLAMVVEELISRCIIKRDALIVLKERLEYISPRSPTWGALARAGEEEIARLYQSGMTQQAIAERFSVTQSAVKNFLTRRGIPRRTRSESARLARRDSPAWAARNKKIAEARRAEWADPVIREARIKAMRAARRK